MAQGVARGKGKMGNLVLACGYAARVIAPQVIWNLATFGEILQTDGTASAYEMQLRLRTWASPIEASEEFASSIFAWLMAGNGAIVLLVLF